MRVGKKEWKQPFALWNTRTLTIRVSSFEPLPPPHIYLSYFCSYHVRTYHSANGNVWTPRKKHHHHHQLCRIFQFDPTVSITIILSLVFHKLTACTWNLLQLCFPSFDLGLLFIMNRAAAAAAAISQAWNHKGEESIYPHETDWIFHLRPTQVTYNCMKGCIFAPYLQTLDLSTWLHMVMCSASNLSALEEETERERDEKSIQFNHLRLNLKPCQ